MKIKPVFIGIAVLGALLLVLSLSSMAKVFGANPREVLAGVKTQPEAVQLLPKRSLAFVSFLVNPERLGLFVQLAAKPSDRANVRHQLDNLKQQLRQNWLLDYERDVQPWLDQEITLAVTDADLDRQPDNGLQTGYLLALVAKDAKLAKTTIDAFWQRLAVNGSDLGFEQYQGVSILSTSQNTHRQSAIAGTTLGKFVLFANDPRVLHKALDNLQSPSLALAGLDTYRDRLAQLDTAKIGFAYINLAELGEELPKANLLMSLGVDKFGIRAKTVFEVEDFSKKIEAKAESTNRKSTKELTKKSSPNIATAIPSGSSVIIGNNLNQTLQDLKDSLTPEWRKLLKQTVAPLAENIDIPLDRDNLAWADDDYAIALLPKTDKIAKANPEWWPDWLIVAKVKDAKASQTAIAALDDAARTKLTVGEVLLKEQPVKVWTQLSAIANKSATNPNASVSGNVVAAHAQTKDYIYLSNSLTVLESAIFNVNHQSITSSSSFKTMLAKAPSDLQTFAYFPKDAELGWLKAGLVKSDIFKKIIENSDNFPTEIFKHFKAVSFASNTNKNVSKVDIQNGEISLVIN